MALVTIDAETYGIGQRPLEYPPKPVGWAIQWPDGRAEYLAFGHPTGNNCSEADAKRVMRAITLEHKVLGHNMRFDLEVLQKWLGLPDILPAQQWHDTLLLAFLDNPHSDTLALKPLSEKLMGLASSERDEVKEWILANVPEAKRKPSQWGAYICKAPGDLVGKYAKGDVTRTTDLFEMLYARVMAAGMEQAYLRERKLIPILIANEQQGIVCDVENLSAHTKDCEEDLARADAWIAKYLNAPGINLDENETLADVLEREGKVTKWEYTEKGARSTAKPSLDRMLEDRLLYAALMYRGSMATCVRTFMSPWLELAASNNGRLYTTWNTTKQEEGGGTRTGRLSSSRPLNLQNIPNDFSEKFGELFNAVGLYDTLDVGELPTMRNYVTADTKDDVLVGFDYGSQEPRTFAHLEYGWLCAKYNVNPRMDVYTELMAVTKENTGVEITRKQAKTVFLGLLYGMGANKLSGQLGVTPADAAMIKNALLEAVPSIRDITHDVKAVLSRGDYIRTWGGRVYYAESPKVIDGKLRTFEYKGLNLYCQGSSADETKESVVRYSSLRKHGRLVLTVHDEIVISVPREHWRSEATLLQSCMTGLELDVPMIADGEYGYRWGTLSPISDV